jgi:hypothetical protein
MGMGFLFTPSSDLVNFVRKRSLSVQGQLAGKSKGTTLSWSFGFGQGPAWLVLAKPILDAADRDRDGRMSKDEAVTATRGLFKALNPEGKPSLDQKALAQALMKVLPKDHVRGGPRGGLPAQLAGRLVSQAGKDGQVSEASLVAAAEKLFAGADRGSGTLDERRLAEGLRRFLPAAPGRMGAPPPPKK